MSYLLDTNACIALINGEPSPVRAQFQKAAASGKGLWVSSIAIFELWYGVFKSSREEFNTRRLRTFLGGPANLLQFSEDDAKAAGMIRANLEKVGRPIGAYDLLMAGQAVRQKLTLVTSNVNEFSRIKSLTWEDWSKP